MKVGPGRHRVTPEMGLVEGAVWVHVTWMRPDGSLTENLSEAQTVIIDEIGENGEVLRSVEGTTGT